MLLKKKEGNELIQVRHRAWHPGGAQDQLTGSGILRFTPCSLKGHFASWMRSFPCPVQDQGFLFKKHKDTQQKFTTKTLEQPKPGSQSLAG